MDDQVNGQGGDIFDFFVIEVWFVDFLGFFDVQRLLYF